MKAEDVFRNLMEADELQTLFGIPKEAVASEKYSGESENTSIELIKNVIRGVEDGIAEPTVYKFMQRNK